MIRFYTGTPGSGKSLRATREILLYLEKGRNVIANYPIIMTKKAVKKGGTFYYWDIKEMTSDNLKAFHKKHHKRIKGREEEPQTLLVIDECQMEYNTRTWQERKRERGDIIEFYSKHRKMFFEVILIAQNEMMVDKQIRNLAEYEVHHRNANNFGNIGIFFKLLRIRIFCAVEYYKPVKPHAKTNVEWFTLRRKDKEAYDSYLEFELDEKKDFTKLPDGLREEEIIELEEETEDLCEN